ncbi:tRNA (adenosine(37)-N6)-dimethylallyltransferase MiaA [Rhizobium sp. YJ-22]|uniref:tRNA (adenosine(37)-N6)-dimethylallyltransferase MiaA n=1 Tax=Rhizobium sp. YJ-22 TaxID=3037556 RepID=UPI002412B8C1|nr:tRNA (adenosine(37)-N6)-dimethylallyltransferase MiaA [Rhizobium sp. YJ-22]MDG3575843.1 tRNA (adenosine(37)-N6)-dimethylallyltransferase MiaA [Rhizobium sp. YJ-22]
MENLLDRQDAILITGPTASGKSALAVKLARERNGVVVNADSMQVYDTLRVLTARPSEAEMEGIPHLLYGHVPAGAAYSTGAWLRDVTELLPRLKAEGKLPVFVGGTGLYFKALTGGLSEMPGVDVAIREGWRGRLAAEGPERLHDLLAARDGAAAAQLNRQDGQRIVRALEILDATGRSITDFQNRTGPLVIDPERAEKYVVLPERSLLHGRIGRRFEQMLDSGAVEEVQALLAQELSPQMPVMKAIGVSQIAAMLSGELDAERVREQGAAATRQYAKRQMTWFRNQMDESWVRLDGAG